MEKSAYLHQQLLKVAGMDPLWVTPFLCSVFRTQPS